MAEKKYSEFPAAAFDKTRIILQADPVSGQLYKTTIPSIPIPAKYLVYFLTWNGVTYKRNENINDLTITTSAYKGGAGEFYLLFSIDPVPDLTRGFISVTPSIIIGGYVSKVINNGNHIMLNIRDFSNTMSDTPTFELLLVITVGLPK